MKASPKISLAFILLLLIAWGFLTFRIGAKWVGHQDENGAWVSTAVVNYQRYGFFNLNGMIALNTEPVTDGAFRLYTHHPPLTVWLSAPLVLLTGYNEALIRFIPAALTLMSGVALYMIIRRIFNAKIALYGMGFYFFTPMMLYFGRMPDHEAPAMLWLLLFGAVALKHHRYPTRPRWLALAVLVMLTVWTSWGGVIVLSALCLPLLIWGNKQQRISLFALAGVGIAALALMLLYYLANEPRTIENFQSAFLYRSSSVSLRRDSTAFTAADYFATLFLRALTLYLPTILMLAFVGLIALRRVRPVTRMAALTFLIGGLIYVALFRNAAYIHDYYLIYIAPSIALLAALGVDALYKKRRFRRWLHPLASALIIFTLPMSVIYLAMLYDGTTQTEPLEVVAALNAHTTPADLIASDLPATGIAIAFYSERQIAWEMPLEQALMLAQTNQQALTFFTCDLDTLDQLVPSPEVSIPLFNETCRMIRIP